MAEGLYVILTKVSRSPLVQRKMAKHIGVIKAGQDILKSMGYALPGKATPVDDKSGDWTPPSDGVACKIYVVQVNYWPYHTALQVEVDSNNDGAFSDNERLTYEVSNDDQGVAIQLYNAFYPPDKIQQKFEALAVCDSPRGMFDTLHAAANSHREAYDILENNCRDVCRRALEHLRQHYRDRSEESAQAVVKLVEIARGASDAVPKTAATLLNLATKGAISKSFRFAIGKYGVLARDGYFKFEAKDSVLFRVDVTGTPA